MILRCNNATTTLLVRTGLIMPAIAERQFVRSGAGGTRQQLMTETDAHDGLSTIKQLLDLLHSALAHGRIAGTVR